MKFGAWIASALALATVGCGDSPAVDPEGLAPADQTYTVLGVVTEVPDEHGRSDVVAIHHESIPDFVSSDGEVVGMHSMSMPFEVAEGVDLEVLSPEDPVRFTFEVRWNTSPTLLVTDIELLPPETEIDFSPLPSRDEEVEGADETPGETGGSDDGEGPPSGGGPEGEAGTGGS